MLEMDNKIYRPTDETYYSSLIVIAIRLMLDLSYYYVVYPNYIYMGFNCSFSLTRYFLSWVILLASLFLFDYYYKNEQRTVSAQFVFFLYVLSFIPFTSLSAFESFDSSFIFSNTVFWFAILILCRVVPSIKMQVGLSPSKSNSPDVIVNSICLVLVSVILFISAKYTHFRFNFSLSNVYDLRAEANSYDLPTVINYVFSASKTSLCLLVFYYLKNRK